MTKPVPNPVLFFWITPDTTGVIWVPWEANDTETQLDVQKFVLFCFRENIYEGNCGRSWRRLGELTECRANPCEGKRERKSGARLGRECGSFKKAWQSCWLNPQSEVSHQRTIHLVVSGISSYQAAASFSSYGNMIAEEATELKCLISSNVKRIWRPTCLYFAVFVTFL